MGEPAALSQDDYERPSFLLVAGPNGSGKSSLYRNTDIETFGRSVWIINPDRLTLRIQEIEGRAQDEANLLAVQRIEAWLDASIDTHQSVGVETVLSTPKYRHLVTKAKAQGFEVHLIYVILDSVQHNVERVRIRFEKGGHSVPEDKIVERHERSLKQFPWFLDQSDRALIFDNSGATPRLIGKKHEGVIALAEDAGNDIIKAVNEGLPQ